MKLLLLCFCSCCVFLATNGEKKHTTLFIGSPKTKGRIKGTHLSTEQLQMLYKGLYATRFSHKIKRHRTSLYIGRKKTIRVTFGVQLSVFEKERFNYLSLTCCFCWHVTFHTPIDIKDHTAKIYIHIYVQNYTHAHRSCTRFNSSFSTRDISLKGEGASISAGWWAVPARDHHSTGCNWGPPSFWGRMVSEHQSRG